MPKCHFPFAITIYGLGFTHQMGRGLCHPPKCCATRPGDQVQGELSLEPALITKHTARSTFLYINISQAMCKLSSVKLNKIQIFWKSKGALPLPVVGVGRGSCCCHTNTEGIGLSSSQFILLKLICHTLAMKIYKELYSFLSSLNPVHIFPG